ncbi:MAG: DUF1292 domain-containing protein [Lachnospiraceae bacterium]|nr:DUF1292 domain-containing protein [Lachnospiraceae bacterium]MDY5742535.1 DUF1292 domain-containing protein [Lachnospiraceae bacterium]
MGYEHENEELEEFATVTLTLDDDQEVECEIITIFEVGEKEYIALTPLGEEEEEEAEVFIYEFIDNGEDAEPELKNIEDDEEYLKVADELDRIFDEMDVEE